MKNYNEKQLQNINRTLIVNKMGSHNILCAIKHMPCGIPASLLRQVTTYEDIHRIFKHTNLLASIYKIKVTQKLRNLTRILEEI